MSALDRITVSPEVCGGRPCIRGLRIRVKDVLDLFAAGATREELYIADEVFMTGTAAEVTPVSEIDYRRIGRGAAGPVALEIRRRYLAAARGEDPDFEHWLTSVD